jgi:glycerol-3-phosphate dehydrogenase
MPREYCSPWPPGWRRDAWTKLGQDWDLIIIGGGITGAGILNIAARSGLRVLLLEKGDFASGTSSRSSKLVHGGLRYLKNMHIRLTRESVKERQNLLQAAPGLIEPLGFVYPVYKKEKPSPWLVELGLGIYTRLSSEAGKYRRLDELEVSLMAPGLKIDNLERGFHYADAQTDDARLVLRVISDGLAAARGRARALNYCCVAGLLKEKNIVRGVRVKDELSGTAAETYGSCVVNATGAWADELRSQVGGSPRLRPLRGSHLYFSSRRFPVYQAVAFSHPEDGRPVFVFPWEGATLAGTTDVDHTFPLEEEPSISRGELDYLLRAVQAAFPELELTEDDVISTQAGVRPVVDTGKKDPSSESREHAIWNEAGLLTVTGGKLTTFRLIALDALHEAHKWNSRLPEPDSSISVFEKGVPDPAASGLGPEQAKRFWGRYGAAASEILRLFPRDFQLIPGTPYTWAELLWSIKAESVCHLDDLLLRRFRLGILLPDGGAGLLPRLKPAFKGALSWNEAAWEKEAGRYLRLREQAHGMPAAEFRK